MFQTSCKEKQYTHFMFVTFFPENGAVYEVMWKNIAQPDSKKWHYGAGAFHAGYLRLKTHAVGMLFKRNVVAKTLLSVAL